MSIQFGVTSSVPLLQHKWKCVAGCWWFSARRKTNNFCLKIQNPKSKSCTIHQNHVGLNCPRPTQRNICSLVVVVFYCKDFSFTFFNLTMFLPCPTSLHQAAANSTGELVCCPIEDVFAGVNRDPSLSVLRSFSPWSCAVRPNFSSGETFYSSEITQRDLTALACCQGPKKLVKPCIIVSPPLLPPSWSTTHQKDIRPPMENSRPP